MVSVLIHKKHLYIIRFLLIILIMLLLCGCDPRAGQYPFQKAESWRSSEPKISLTYTQNEDKTWNQQEFLYWNGEQIEIDLAMQSGDYCVYPADSNRYEDRLFSGSWQYQGEDLVLIVVEDFIFENQYKHIVLKAQGSV